MTTRDITYISPGVSTPGTSKCDSLHEPLLVASLWNSVGGLSQVPVAQEKELSWWENLPIFAFEQVYDSEGMLSWL